MVEELNLTLDKNSVAEFEESFKTFSGELKNNISELKEINSESVGIKDERQGIVIEIGSRKFNAQELSNIAIQIFDYVLNKRIGGSSETPSYIG